MVYQAQNLHFTRDNKHLINNLTISLLPHSLNLLIGPNGIGKTTLLKILAGLLDAHSGSRSLKGVPIELYERKTLSQEIGFVTENLPRTFGYTVKELVEMGLYNTFSLQEVEKKEAVQNTLIKCQLEHLQTTCIHELSMGEKRRVHIAKSLVANPSVIFLDEPTANLDLRHKHLVWQLLIAMKKSGKAILVVSHDIDVGESYAGTCLLLNKGILEVFHSLKEEKAKALIKKIFHLP